MPATWFIADLHLFHEKVTKIRGFDSLQAHVDHIANRWVKQVKPDDIVHVLGDISGGGREAEEQALHTLMALPGRKRLKSGNHDSTSGRHKAIPNAYHRSLIHETFESVNDYGWISHEGKPILLSHYPYWASQDGPTRGEGRYEQFRLPDLGGILIHGHTHHNHPTNGSATGREICVSWDAWGRMVNMGDIAQLIKKIESISFIEYARKIREDQPRYKPVRFSDFKDV